MRATAELAVLVADEHALAIGDPEALGVAGVEEQRLAQGARERVAALLDHAVELLAAPGREREALVGRRRRGDRDDGEMGLSVRGAEAAALAEQAPAVLDRLAALAQILDPAVVGDRHRDLTAD